MLNAISIISWEKLLTQTFLFSDLLELQEDTYLYLFCFLCFYQKIYIENYLLVLKLKTHF